MVPVVFFCIAARWIAVVDVDGTVVDTPLSTIFVQLRGMVSGHFLVGLGTAPTVRSIPNVVTNQVISL